MEKVRPWYSQPSDRGRLKNRTEQPHVTVVTITTLFNAPKNCRAVVSRGGCVHCEAEISRGELSPLDKSAAPYCRHVCKEIAVRGQQ